MKKHTEIRFEEAMGRSLVAEGGYAPGDPATFDRDRALDSTLLLPFIQQTQPKLWEPIAAYHGKDAEKVVLDDLCRTLDSQGMLNVLRHGFKCFGKRLRVAYFAPASGMNPETTALYQANRLTVTRQLKYSTRNENSLDLVLSINGLPVVTAELKNPMSGQTVEHAKGQYQKDRDPKELLFQFKKRALVHFAVDPDQVYMTTRLAGTSTFFLPFNKGDQGGAGNPENPEGYRSAYLWEDVWQRDSLLDIIGRFMHLQVEEKKIAMAKGIKTQTRETMIFPRYHQLDAVRKMVSDARGKGPGHNYLVQHSAGSGKSNSIAWLAHRLAGLHNDKDEKVFDSVVVITDRLVLDQQLQDTIYQFEHKKGVVQKIDEDSTQLAEALKQGTPIVITTLQKFPFVTQKVGDLPERRYAVIIDEAHSSQSGETATEMKGVLAATGIKEKAKQEAEAQGLDDAGEAILKTMLKRGKQPNISFFAFTATPKYKTLHVFNEPGPTGSAPFHLYTMRQAIEEGFIMDVLKHYTTYKAYYGLIKSVEDDPQVEKKKAARALARFISFHPHNLAQKTEVMVEHFRTHTRHKIGGRAKAMVVTSSRLHAVRYKQHFDKYIADNGYKDIRTLVAFSGTVEDPDFKGKNYTEVGMNEGIKEKELPEKFAGDNYQVLLVAEKYQTGFDQPLLHSMYVDKRLSGIQAVQTLSRLNRTTAGKEDTFVLDFVNDASEIFESFKPYYERTPLGEDVNPQKLNELQAGLDAFHVYFEQEVEAFCKVFFKPHNTPGDHKAMNGLLDHAVSRFKDLVEDDQEEFRSLLVSFRSLYGFLSQIIPYQDSELEKLYTYLRFLHSKLPPRKGGPVYTFDDEVKLKYYRLQKISEGSIALNEGEAKPLKGPTEVGTGKGHEEFVELSQLIGILNDRFGTDFKPADQLFFDQIREEAAADESLRQAAKVNTLENFKFVFDKALESLIIDRMEGNEEIFSRLMNDKAFHRVASDYLLHQVYGQIREEVE
ncbi:type I restriction endonuclease subunit R [Geoalkalibacter halelectricus]|uniref:Type I restriction endonuclease n=1 Tax=Geoalkalibacter halelectricus TaxID=2847045 RepID=A0ABY5ZQH1_9BACT|nr:type I restriction endonuclease [Geoalkalibacter halelectricus]MDO3378546.1 type I restriction endonuclease [Geoalkalibacter halelectricus]UWZ80140.1 type I restriction endonuclease [Geoalkalibacter halelectricus]